MEYLCHRPRTPGWPWPYLWRTLSSVVLRLGMSVDVRLLVPDNGFLDIAASLVAALVPKPIVVTGWNLGDPLSSDDTERQGGACSTHLAVPAGAVYYFEADTSEAAVALAIALNWHGATNGSEIQNRRSTLMGEKGFGLGVCGTWEFYPGESK